jgi:hypothetical protein
VEARTPALDRIRKCAASPSFRLMPIDSGHVRSGAPILPPAPKPVFPVAPFGASVHEASEVSQRESKDGDTYTQLYLHRGQHPVRLKVAAIACSWGT